MKIKITADSTCDLSPELVEKYNVGIMPLHVSLGEEDYLDGVTIQPQTIYEYYAANMYCPKAVAALKKSTTTFLRVSSTKVTMP